MFVPEIRKVRPEEAAELAALAREIWLECFPPVIGEARTRYILERFHSPEHIARELADGSVTYVAGVEDGRFVSYLGYRSEGDGLFVTKVYVREDCRKKGYAKAMFRHILRENPDVAFLRLHVNRNNRRAYEAYTRLGFVKVGLHDEDIGEGFLFDDYVMQWDEPAHF